MLSILLVLIVCFLIGALVHTALGRAAKKAIGNRAERVPGRASLQDPRAEGRRQVDTWQPALIEIEEALVPGFIVEPSMTTAHRVRAFGTDAVCGAVYIIERRRVHPLDVPFTQAIKSISRWGTGSKELVAAMKREQPAP